MRVNRIFFGVAKTGKLLIGFFRMIHCVGRGIIVKG